MAPSVHVPAELVESILDGLDGDAASLRQCALVGHLFYSHSQKLLFKRISLGRPSKKEMVFGSLPADNFYNHVTTFPHLTKHVCELVISDDSSPNSETMYYREDTSWLRTDEEVAKILPLLGGLEELVIKGNQDGNELDFHAWRPELKSAILSTAPKLTRLSLLCLRHVPLHILNDVPKLKNLTLNHVLFAAEHGFPAPSTSRRAVLEIFNLTTSYRHEWSSIHLWLQTKDCALDMTHLTTLHIKLPAAYTGLEIYSGELKTVPWLINGCTNSVRELNISFPPEVTSLSEYDDSYIDLGSLPNLRKLSLQGRLWSWETCDSAKNAFTWLFEVLGRIQPNNVLSHVDLSLTIVDWRGFSRADFAEASWDDLVKALLRLEGFSSVSITFSSLDVRGPYIEDILKERTALLSKRGMVTLATGYTGDMSDN